MKSCKILASLLCICSIALSTTSGPSAPEVGTFQPVDVDNLVDLSTGDFAYNLPVVHIPGPSGGYSMSLSYQSGIRVDQEASWVGLGWNLQPGAISRTVIGVPDDFDGVDITQGSTDCDMSLNFSASAFGYAHASTSLSFKQRGVSVAGASFGGDMLSRKRLGISSNSNTSVSSMNIGTRGDIGYDKRWGNVGLPGDGDAFGMSLSSSISLALLSAQVGEILDGFTFGDLGGGGTVSASAGQSLSFRWSQQNKRVWGAYYLHDFQAGRENMSDLVMENDLQMTRERIENADPFLAAIGVTPEPIPNEGMIHLASDIYNINAQGLNGSMRVRTQNKSMLKGRSNKEISLDLSLNVSFDDIEALISELGNTNVSASGIYKWQDYENQTNSSSYFELMGLKNNGGYDIEAQTPENGTSINAFVIKNPLGVTYKFDKALNNTYQYSWSSSIPNGPNKVVRKEFSALHLDTYWASFSDNEMVEPYAYTWKLGEIEYPSKKKVKFRYRGGSNNLLNWRSPTRGTALPSAKTPNNMSQVSFGTKEISYLESVNTETHMAFFYTSSDRNDGYGIRDKNDNGLEIGGLASETTLERLDDIIIITLLEDDPEALAVTLANGWSDYTDRVTKRIHFEYGYDLAKGCPTNLNGGGKLTLEKVEIYGRGGYGFHLDYEFGYKNNPDWDRDSFDRWGYYSTNSNNHFEINDNVKIDDRNTCEAASWSLSDIKLPTGGTIEIGYSNDEYEWAENNEDISDDGVPGGGICVSTLKVVSSDGEVLGGDTYKYAKGATASEPLAYTALHTEDFKYEQILAGKYGKISASSSQNGNFYKPGPGVVYGEVIKTPLSVTTNGNGYTISKFYTPQDEYFQISGTDPDDMIDFPIPDILKLFRHIGILPYGKGLCVDLPKICIPWWSWSRGWHKKCHDPAMVCVLPPGAGFMWNPYKFDVGPSKSVAEAIFGPYGQLQREFISLDWDISDSKFEYEYKDFSSRIGQKQNEYIYNSHDQLQQETIYQFYDPMNGQGIPTFDFNDYNTLQTTAQMEPYNSYEAAAEKSGWILGMNLTLNSAGLSIGGKIYREQAVNYKTEYEYYPFFNSTKKVRFFDDDPNIYNEIVEEYSAYNPLTNKPVLTMNNHPENPEKMLYTLSVPAYTKFDFLEGLNMYDVEYQQIRGVVLNNSITTPLSSKISEWGLLETGEEVPPGEPTPELPVVTKSYVWRGGVNPTIYLNNATNQNWLLTNELLEINEYGLPLREIDGLGTISSVIYDKDKVTLVAVNADPNEVVYDNFQGEINPEENLLDSKAGRYKIIPANIHEPFILPAGESFVDFIASSDTPGPIQVSVDGTTYILNLLRNWQYFKFEYHSNSSVNLVVNSDGRETKFDELRAYPQASLVSNFIYDPYTSELIAIEDANGQITNYRYDDFNQLAMITNSRDQLLKRFYYDSQNMHFTAVPEP